MYSSETIERANVKLGTIDYHLRVTFTRELMTSWRRLI